MTVAELIADCERCLELGVGLTLVYPKGHRQIANMRGELLCVNSKEESVYRYNEGQIKRLLVKLRNVV